MAKKKHIAPSSEQRQLREISDFLKNDYKEYAKYVISTRAIPSMIDGFKVGARKVMHAALNGGMKNGKEIKNLNLVGDVYNYTLYNHGDASLHGTVFTLSQFFKDNLNPLSINGQCGTLRDEGAVSAPRYLHVRHSQFIGLYKTDYDLLEYVFDEGQYLEPKHYLPIIPTVLTSRTKGMAPGYAFETFSYNPLDIIDSCLDVLLYGNVLRRNRPYVRGIKPETFRFDAELNRWVNYGLYETDIKSDTVFIKDLPYDIGYDQFERRLNKLLESGYIRDWQNNSEGENINYWVMFHKTRLARELEEDRYERFIKNLMLRTAVPANTLCVLDEHDRVKTFASENQLIEHFVKYRLKRYSDRKTRLVNVISDKLKQNSDICKFIELVIKKKIKIMDRPKSEIKADLDSHNLPHSVLSIQVSKLTQEEREELLKKNDELKKELEYIQSTSEKNMYIRDLVQLHNQYESLF